MRLRALLPGVRDEDLVAAALVAAPRPLDVASPWAPTHNLSRVLDGLVLSDVFGPAHRPPLTREEAMAVPAVARARHILCGTVARIPLRAYRGRQVLEGPAAPAWINATDGAVPAYHRDLWTADDHLFYGWSCWSRTNGTDGFPLRMERIPMGRWSVDDAGRVLVDALDGQGPRLVDQRTVKLLPGPHAGILTEAAASIRHAADLQYAALQAAKTPAAHLALVQTQGIPLPYDSEDPTVVTVKSTVRDWAAARRGDNGGVAFIPLGLEPRELGTFDAHLLTEGRNAAAVDVARVVSLPADLLDAAGPSSLTYQTTRDNDQRAVQYGVGLYLSALSAAHTHNATPAGTEVRYALEEWLEDPTNTGAAAAPAAPAPAPAEPAGNVVPFGRATA